MQDAQIHPPVTFEKWSLHTAETQKQLWLTFTCWEEMEEDQRDNLEFAACQKTTTLKHFHVDKPQFKDWVAAPL